MATPLNQDEKQRLETFISESLLAAEQLPHDQLVQQIEEHKELLRRSVQSGPAAADVGAGVSQADLDFLKSWLKARNLILGGMEFLKLADQENARTIQHEIECTETAFSLLPRLIEEARPYCH